MKISPEAREAAANWYLGQNEDISVISDFRDGKLDWHPACILMQSLINSTLERAAGVAEERARVLCGFEGVFAAVYVRASELNAAATAIRQLMEGE